MRVVRRSEREFEELFTANSRPLLAYALRRTSTPSDAADVVAETMLIAWRRLDQVPDGGEARLWLYGVARRVMANRSRSERRRDRLGSRLAEVVERAVAEQSDDEVVGSAVMAEALAQLDDAERELLRLTSWEQLTPTEIAVVLEIPAGTVRSRLYRARAELRSILERSDAMERCASAGHVDVGSDPLLHLSKEEL